MGLNLFVWHEAKPITAEEAGAKLDRWNAGDTGAFAHHTDIGRFHEALLHQFPPGKDSVWSADPEPSDQVVAASAAWLRAAEVSEAVVALAASHGLVCYEPASRILNPNAPGYVAAYVLTGAGVPTIPDPDVQRLDWAVRRLNDATFFAVLDRADGAYAQIGYGSRAGLAAGTFALEHQDDEGHFRTETRDVDEAVRFLQGYLTGDDAWRTSHAWERLKLG